MKRLFDEHAYSAYAKVRMPGQYFKRLSRIGELTKFPRDIKHMAAVAIGTEMSRAKLIKQVKGDIYLMLYPDDLAAYRE